MCPSLPWGWALFFGPLPSLHGVLRAECKPHGPSPEIHLRQGSILCGVVALHSWWPGWFCLFGHLQLYSVSAVYYSLGVSLDTTLPCRAASCYCCRPVATASFAGSVGWMIYPYLFNVTVPSNSILCRLRMASLGSDVFFTGGTLGLRFLIPSGDTTFTAVTLAFSGPLPSCPFWAGGSDDLDEFP